MRKALLIIALIGISFSSFSQDIFDIGIRKIEIFFNEPNWDDTLDVYYANDSSERLIADSILIDGISDQDVGVKYKGNSSYNVNNAKNPISIKLDYVHNGQSIDGYNVLKLSNGFKDPTFVREVLGYEMAREYMPASKATYANVFINGAWNGLYTLVQSVDDDFLNEHFYERKGPFFKVDNTNVTVAGCPGGPNGIWKYYSDTNCLKKAYEMQSTDDWTPLGNFLDTLNNYFTEVESVLDIDRTLWMLAYNNLLVGLDGPVNAIPHNFYMFQDNNKRFSPILWDMNMTFGTFTNGFNPPPIPTDLQQLDIFHGSTNAQNRMTVQMFSDDRYKRMYIAHMRTIMNEQFVNNNYYNRALQLQSIIDSSVNADPNLFYTYNDFTTNLTNVVGGGPNGIIGITELMNGRVAYLQSITEFTASPPTVSVLNTNSVIPHTSVNIIASIANANYAYLGYRYTFADKFEKLQMLDDGQHGDGSAGDGVFGATINVDARDVQYYIYAENNDAGIFSPERAEKEFHQIPVVSGLVINEIMAGNFSAVADQDGEYDDWVELYNGNNYSINLDGYYLSDNENEPTKWSFPNVTIAPNDYLIIWCDTAGGAQAGLHTTYRLSGDQEEVYLSDEFAITIDAVHYVNMPTDQGYARVPNGTGTMRYQDHTYDASNQLPSLVSDFNNVSKIRVYPNPSNSRIYILGAKEEIYVHDIMGKEIFSDKYVNSVDISNWESGIYFVKSGDSVVKIIKQ
ncbi:MAG: T9SS type A sorting domain-containing protein [Flavobacteriales bacterium]|nr:T9SS type A sorting domain-containing protein [Flavobacteriales bacterium]